MKIIEIKALRIPEIKILRFGRFPDNRGYFVEPFRESDFRSTNGISSNFDILQCNESYSKPSVIRGLHFQWNPFMGKIVRTLTGRMVDMVVDIRKGSPTFGKAIAYDMPADFSKDYAEWIWVPPGFAHGNFFTKESSIEYFCTGEHSPSCEAGISPLATDIDWSLCDVSLKNEFDTFIKNGPLMSDKDKNGFSLKSWAADARSDNFVFGKM